MYVCLRHCRYLKVCGKFVYVRRIIIEFDWLFWLCILCFHSPTPFLECASHDEPLKNQMNTWCTMLARNENGGLLKARKSEQFWSQPNASTSITPLEQSRPDHPDGRFENRESKSSRLETLCRRTWWEHSLVLKKELEINITSPIGHYDCSCVSPPKNTWKLCSSTSHIFSSLLLFSLWILAIPFFVFHQYARERKKTADASLVKEYSLTKIAQMLKYSSTPGNATPLTPSKFEKLCMATFLYVPALCEERLCGFRGLRYQP